MLSDTGPSSQASSADVRIGTLLYVANRLPWPLDDGWKRRTFAVLQGLSRITNVQVVVPSVSEPNVVKAFAAAAGPNTHLVLAEDSAPASPLRTAMGSLFSRESPLSMRHYTTALEQTVVDAVTSSSPAAVVYVGAFLAERHARSAIAHVPFILDTHNIDSHAMARRARSLPLLRAMAMRFVSRRLYQAEIDVFSKARAVLVCSEEEVPLVCQRAKSATTYVVPNGVDTGIFRAAPPLTPGATSRLLFFGNLDYPPNIDAIQYFVRDINPVLQKRGVPFRLEVVGAGKATRIRELTAGLDNVQVMGLSDNLLRTLHESDAVVVPLRAGGGTRLKVLEALSSGRLVISTRVGAEGIAVEDGVHLIFAETPSDFADAIVSLRKAPERASRIAHAGAELARSSYSWDAIQARLGDIIRASVGSDRTDMPSGGV